MSSLLLTSTIADAASMYQNFKGSDDLNMVLLYFSTVLLFYFTRRWSFAVNFMTDQMIWALNYSFKIQMQSLRIALMAYNKYVVYIAFHDFNFTLSD